MCDKKLKVSLLLKSKKTETKAKKKKKLLELLTIDFLIVRHRRMALTKIANSKN